MDKIGVYLAYPFVQNALIVGVLIALCAGLLGVILVLKRLSLLGTGLSNIAFCSSCIAAVVGVMELPFILFITTLCSVWLFCRKDTKLTSDSAIAVVSVASLGLGYIVLNLFAASGNLSGDVCATMFGSTSILTLTQTEVYVCIILAIVTVLIYLYLYNKLFALSFDSVFYKTAGLKTDIYMLIVSIITGSIIVLAMNLVGSLLISGLLVFPALTSIMLFRSYKSVTISSAIISIIIAVLGILVSIIYGTPVGSTILVAHLILFVLIYLVTNLNNILIRG